MFAGVEYPLGQLSVSVSWNGTTGTGWWVVGGPTVGNLQISRSLQFTFRHCRLWDRTRADLLFISKQNKPELSLNF